MIRFEGLRVSAPADAWCQLATRLSLDHLIAVGDALVRRQHPYATVEELRQRVESFRGHRGARRLAVVLEAVRSGVDSPKETELRLILVRAGLLEPEVNATIRNRYGAFIAYGDLVYREQRVLIEYDGLHHFADLRQAQRDIDRLDELMEEGWRVIRVTSAHLRQRATLIARVREALVARAGRASAPD